MKHISKTIKPNKTESPIEETLFQEFGKYDLVPIPQYQVGVFYIDLAFPDIKLAIEADGKMYHSTKEQKERDKFREDKLKGLGWTIERFTGSFIHRSFEMAVAKIVLKYMKDKLSKEQEFRAIGRVVNYFTKKDPYFALRLTNEYLDW